MIPQYVSPIQLILVALFTLFPSVGMAQTTQSLYTSLDVKQCRTAKSSSAEAGDYEGRCKGVAGYELIVTEGDLRQNITVVTPAGAKHSLALWQVISGGFSSVGSKAEWRVRKENGKSKPIALIVRFNANEDPEHPDKITSYLAVAKISSKEICVTAKISPAPNANDVARQAADEASSKPCLKLPE